MLKHGTTIGFDEDAAALIVADDPVIPYIEGDGIGPDVMSAARRVLDAAVKKAYGGKRTIVWKELLAGGKAKKEMDEHLPQETIDAIQEYRVSIKGPLTTPVGGGMRSLNVTLRQTLDLYACVRPVRHFAGVPSPMRSPEKVDLVIFRENTEDVYAGIEWQSKSPEAERVIGVIKELGHDVPSDSGIGIKPISEERSKRIVRAAIMHAKKHGLSSVTLMHKGNIMKYTEGAFMRWGYEAAAKEFSDVTITEEDAGDAAAAGKIIIKDRIADSMFQQILLRPEQYDVIVTTNLNGDYLSDAAAAQVGGIGIAPGANINYEKGIALFEATHGSAPKYAGMDLANPSSLILSGVMMLEHLGWQEAADVIVAAMEKTIRQKKVTYDFARLLDGAEELRTSEFAGAIIEHMA